MTSLVVWKPHAMTQIDWINFKKLYYNCAVTGLCIFRVQIHLMEILWIWYLDLCSAVLVNFCASYLWWKYNKPLQFPILYAIWKSDKPVLSILLIFDQYSTVCFQIKLNTILAFFLFTSITHYMQISDMSSWKFRNKHVHDINTPLNISLRVWLSQTSFVGSHSWLVAVFMNCSFAGCHYRLVHVFQT